MLTFLVNVTILRFLSFEFDSSMHLLLLLLTSWLVHFHSGGNYLIYEGRWKNVWWAHDQFPVRSSYHLVQASLWLMLSHWRYSNHMVTGLVSLNTMLSCQAASGCAIGKVMHVFNLDQTNYIYCCDGTNWSLPLEESIQWLTAIAYFGLFVNINKTFQANTI